MAAFNLKEAIAEALTSLGGSGTAAEVREYVKSKFGRDWGNIEQVMDDLTVESESAFFPPEERVLRRLGQGKYALKETLSQEPAQEIAAEEPKPTTPEAASETTAPSLEATIASYTEKLKKVLSQPTYNFIRTAPNEIPTQPGVYLVRDDTSNEIIYAGRTRNLRKRILQQHKQGNREGSFFRRALSQKLNLSEEARISEYITNNCTFQYLLVDSFEERLRLGHFMTAILAPTLNTKPKK